ncbi:PadR family transcriptional regulator [Infirmifilum lucidum]|uniref:PadR family transcriptional regulator n=1 Tax=Infirmifilum lucidum TaxID=2776706 RepID=A0A7L9FH90_9CREN|nr:PadR family transcriptional regulator [Infirmifilum lucidum]QOJ79129.1 PadR family transcriptional regulator [Infirmifilum lucidum]
METRALERLKKKIQVEVLWLYIASILSEGDAYAYDISKKIEAKHGFNPGKVLPYVVLGKMESEGLVKSYYVERRKYYTLTEKGRQAYCHAISMLKALLEKLPKEKCSG